jgi:8-oxo-dGTP pyrophosphatase MutT (NUDIX family)
MSNTPPKWKIIEKEKLMSCRVFEMYRHRCQHPVDNREADFFVIDSVNWVNVVPITANNEIVLVRQYRYGSDELSWEIPGGLIDPGEEPLEAALRELREETGYTEKTAVIVGNCYPNPAILTNKCTFVLANGVEKTADQKFDEHEDIEVGLFPWENIDSFLSDPANGLFHSLTINAIYFAKQYLISNNR